MFAGNILLVDLRQDVTLASDTGNGLSPESFKRTLFVGRSCLITGTLGGSVGSGASAATEPSDIEMIANHSAGFAVRSTDPNASFAALSGYALDGNACGTA